MCQYAGQILVELQDADGQAYTGFQLDDCDPVRGDAIAGMITWNGNTDVSRLAGKPVRIRFVMNEADIYSFRFPADTTDQ